MRDWLQDIGHRDGLAVAFDTWVNGLAVLTGRASRRIARLLKRHSYRLVAAPQCFLVCSHGTLLDGEASWARRWGMTLGAASKTYVQNRSWQRTSQAIGCQPAYHATAASPPLCSPWAASPSEGPPPAWDWQPVWLARPGHGDGTLA
jgi:hypothetical protein